MTMAQAANPFPGIPFVESPLFDRWLESADLSDNERDAAVQLHEKGFAVLDFPDDDFDALAENIMTDLATLPQFEPVTKIAEGVPAGAGMRVQDHIENESVKRIAANEKIIALLSKIYGRRAFPFQTLNFAMGTEQPSHSDSVHFSSVPERYMAGVWVALEDIGPEQGPLVYYPGSHKWPLFHNDELSNSIVQKDGKRGQTIFHDAWDAMIEINGVKPMHFHAKKGQALIWSANLLHGGSAHTDRLKTRWSQVTHYFFEDCAYTTPMLSNPRLGTVFLRNNVKNLVTGKYVPNKYMGRPVQEELAANTAMQEFADFFAGSLTLKEFVSLKLRKRREARRSEPS